LREQDQTVPGALRLSGGYLRIPEMSPGEPKTANGAEVDIALL